MTTCLGLSRWRSAAANLAGHDSWRANVLATRWRRVLPLFGAFLLIVSFCACVQAQGLPLKAEPVPGWPELQIETHYVARIAMRGHCFPVPAGTPIPNTALDSCARPDFWREVCTIFIDVQSLRRAELLEHEKMRCRGHDHHDEDLLADALRAWRERGENRYADMIDFASLMFVLEPLTE